MIYCKNITWPNYMTLPCRFSLQSYLECYCYLPMSGRYGFSSGFPSGKSLGWNGATPHAFGMGPWPHSIPQTFLREIPRKTHTFPPLVNKNIPLYLRSGGSAATVE